MAARAAADEVLNEEIAARRAGDPDAHDDILSMLLSATDEDGNPLSDKALRDELVTLLVAGHETTATALAWSLERLPRTPQALSTLIAEQRATARVPRGRRQGDAAPAPGRAGVARVLPGADDDRRLRSAGRHPHRALDLSASPAPGPLSRAARLPARALPRRDPPGTYHGSRSAAACAAVSAPASPCSRCARCSR